ncbi:Eco57I restriction-modification methylase domain-containing protein [Promethearchaeum syntrophicum]|uniref:site-specific DNA-methyltransferase (adenine-specific) n=1 Tax=Promethearchaeum syntrophicum TaxID=2594042 RepID=A0A5B9DE83_9ARCH|nr:Eco57I restriction-modification methylase domain-containing protein [Candidatus Prometheoarchaeum syntrophicum]QEE17083.1 Eco57I restriction-modification methylase [Candidatus Prometheoarchaeum syntrophicum]
MDKGIKGKLLNNFLNACKIIQNHLIETESFSESNINSIHQFLSRLLALGCIYFSNGNHPSEYKEMKKAIFFQFFKKRSKSTDYNFDQIIFQKILLEKLKTTDKYIPDIFQNTKESNKFSKWKFKKIQLELLYENLWESFEFNLTEISDNEGKKKKNENIIHPGLLGELLENVKYIEQKTKIQKGIFYTPLSEIKFSVLMALNNHFLINHPNLSSSDKKNIIDIIYRIFKNQNEFSMHEIENLVKYLNYFQNLRIIDPACGSGSFLYQILNFFLIILKKNNVDSKFMQFPSINGVDIDKWAILTTQFRLWALISTRMSNENEKLKNFYRSRINISRGDFILENEKLDFNNEGYDIIIGNPPYIRHRDIFNLQDNSPKANHLYRIFLHSSLKSITNIAETEKSRLDYYMYFFYHGLKKLRSQGILAFIVSNSWMNVKYGFNFQEYICKFYNIKQIFDNEYRSFQKAQINTVIAIFHKPKEKTDGKNVVKFIKWKIPYKELLYQKDYSDFVKVIFENNIFIPLETSNSNFKIVDNKTFRECSCPQNIVYHLKNKKNTYDRSKPSYAGYNWANYFFNAPLFYFELLKKIRKGIVYLRDIATIQRGLTTNCNNYFIVKKIDEKFYLNGYGDKIAIDPEFLLPIISSPKQLSKPNFNPDILNTKLFYCNKSKEELEKGKYLKTLEYIRYGEKKKLRVKKGAKKGEFITGIQNLASFIEKHKKKSNNWYSLSSNLIDFDNVSLKSPTIIFQKIFNTTYKMGFSDEFFVPNNTFYKITLKKAYIGQERLVFNLLLSAFSMLSIELQGRTNFGGGALDTATFNIEEIILLDPLFLSKTQKDTINQHATSLLDRNFKSSQAEFQDKNRKKFDEIILNLLPISLDRDTLYKAIMKIQNKRISRSKTFNSKHSIS